jgi:hypothetical protein
MDNLMRYAIVGLALVLTTGCGSDETPQARSDRARDSSIAESAVPGAAGVKSALSVSDSANARRALEDSIMSADDQ